MNEINAKGEREREREREREGAENWIAVQDYPLFIFLHLHNKVCCSEEELVKSIVTPRRSRAGKFLDLGLLQKIPLVFLFLLLKVMTELVTKKGSTWWLRLKKKKTVPEFTAYLRHHHGYWIWISPGNMLVSVVSVSIKFSVENEKNAKS